MSEAALRRSGVLRFSGRGVVKRRLARGALYFVLSLTALLWLLPVAIAVYTAIRPDAEIILRGLWSMPRELTLDNFIVAWTDGDLDLYFRNSFIIVVPSVLLVLFFGSLAAYVLARHPFRGSRVVVMILLAGNLLPAQILLVPVFRLVNLLGIYDTYWAPIGIHVGFGLGFYTFVLYNFMRGIPRDLSEAAVLDGASVCHIYRYIIMPLSRPALGALGTLSFTFFFNDLLWPLVLLRSTDKMPVTAGLANLQGQYVSSWSVVVAAALLAAIPTLIVFFRLQKHFQSGLLLGAE